MALKKPSDLFNKKETSGVFESPEVSSHIVESYDKFRDNFEKVNELSEKVEVLSQELSEKLTKSDLENAMLSHLMVLDENFKSLQNQIKGLNKQDLKEFKETVVSLAEIVDNIVKTELPKYKKQITKNELYVGEQVNQLQGIVETNISGIREEIGEKFDNIADVVDNNIEYFNQKLEETSTQVKKTTETYTNISKILENKVSQENEKFEEYSELIENLSQAFEQLSGALKEELNISSQLTEEKFEKYRKQFETFSTQLETSVDVRLEDYHKEILDIKADVVISEQHIKNVDKYIQEHHQELVELKEEVFAEIKKLPVGNLQENIQRLEKKIDYIKETYSKIEPEVIVKEVIKEGLLNDSPETKNSDPLTPLNQNFVTLEQLQEHYRLFISRIQQQLSTLGGGGETRLQYLDDIVGIATNASAYDGKFLKYNHSLGKFEFVTAGGGAGSQTLDDTLQLGNTSSLGMSVGVVTATSFVGNLTGAASTATTVDITNTNGLTTIYYPTFVENRTDGQILRGDVDFSYVTDDNRLTVPNISATEVVVGSAVTINSSGLNVSGFVTATTFVGNLTGSATTAATVDILNTNGLSNVFYPTFVEFREDGQILRGDVDFKYDCADNTLTVSQFVGNLTGTAITATTAGYASTAGIATVSQGLTGTPNIQVGIITATDYRVQSVSEKTTLVNGNSVSLVYNTGSGNVAICTNPSGDVSLSVTGIPTDSSFDNRSLTFSVIVNNTGTARSCTSLTLNGVSRTIKWFGGSLSAAISGVTTSSGYDIYNFTGINTVGSASTTTNYDILGTVNGGYR